MRLDFLFLSFCIVPEEVAVILQYHVVSVAIGAEYIDLLLMGDF